MGSLTLCLVGQELVARSRGSLLSREVLVSDLGFCLHSPGLQPFCDRADMAKATLRRDGRRRKGESGEET